MIRPTAMMRAAAALVLPLVLGFASPASADPAAARKAEARQRLEQALSAVEFVPDRQVLLGLHPEVPRMLLEIARGKTLRPLARTRAITVLRFFPGPETAALLESLLDRSCPADDGLCRLDQQQALASYAQVKGPAALPRLAPFLAHAHLDLRLAAALALRLSGSPRALPLLAERLGREPSDTVRAELQHQMRLMERAER